MCLRTQRISSMFCVWRSVGRGNKKYEKERKIKTWKNIPENVMEKSINNWAWTNLIITLKFFFLKIVRNDQIKRVQERNIKKF